MDYRSFWLIDVKETTLAVSYVVLQNNSYSVAALGQSIAYQPDNDSIVVAADASLSQSAESISLPSEDEPDVAALIVPPFWIDSEGRINPHKNKLIESLFKGLKLKPMGFIASDEAIVESANINDGFPASFILVDINRTVVSVTLTYLGKITKRVVEPIDSHFEPSLVEKCLIEFNTESTLPPQIILIGEVDDMVLESVKNYPWIGKKNVETFLHFPEIKAYSPLELTSIYVKTISHQFKEVSLPPAKSDPVVQESIDEIVEPDISEPIDPLPLESLVEVTPTDLGFNQNIPPQIVTDTVVPPVPDNFEYVAPGPLAVEESLPPPPKINRPKFKLKIRLPSVSILPWILGLSPVLILIPFLLSTAKITLSLTPIVFDKQISVTLDPDIKNIDSSKKIIPVNVKSIQVNSSVSISTTGEKTTGEKAQGEITIYNKQDKVQNLPKGTVFVDDQGKKFELNNPTQIASSSSNLDAGVITLGQTKALITAADIGPEYNLIKDVKLRLKDIPESIIIAKTRDTLTGGTKRQTKIVSAQDKTNIDQKLKLETLATVDKQIKKESESITGIIDNTTQIKSGRTDYNREVSEEADTLTASSSSTVSLYYLQSSDLINIIEVFLSSEPEYQQAVIDPALLETKITDAKVNGSKIQGKLHISGKSLPKIDQALLAKSISGKSVKTAEEIIKKLVPRAYLISIKTNLSLLKPVNPLPFLLKNITFETKL